MVLSVVESHIPLARWRARKFYRWSRAQGFRLDYDDMEAEAYLALVIAERGFRPEVGVKFSTYAVACMHSRLYRLLTNWNGLTLGHREAIKSGDAAPVRRFSLDQVISENPDGGVSVRLEDALIETRQDTLEWLDRCDKRLQVMELFRKAKPKLTKAERDCIILVFLCDMTPNEAAVQRGTSASAVCFSVRSGLSKIRRGALPKESGTKS